MTVSKARRSAARSSTPPAGGTHDYAGKGTNFVNISSLTHNIGNDTVNLTSAQVASLGTIDGGNTTDTDELDITTGGTLTGADLANISFESWTLSANAAYDLSLVDSSVIGFETLIIDGSATSSLVIDGTGVVAGGRLAITGGAGNDTLTAGESSDFINGNAGNDTIIGSVANNILQGEPRITGPT